MNHAKVNEISIIAAADDLCKGGRHPAIPALHDRIIIITAADCPTFFKSFFNILGATQNILCAIVIRK